MILYSRQNVVSKISRQLLADSAFIEMFTYLGIEMSRVLNRVRNFFTDFTSRKSLQMRPRRIMLMIDEADDTKIPTSNPVFVPQTINKSKVFHLSSKYFFSRASPLINTSTVKMNANIRFKHPRKRLLSSESPKDVNAATAELKTMHRVVKCSK